MPVLAQIVRSMFFMTHTHVTLHLLTAIMHLTPAGRARCHLLGGGVQLVDVMPESLRKCVPSNNMVFNA